MPPPNITGQLHLGHALFLTLQDIRTRWHGQRGDDTLWLPGTDHAGLATHDKILEQMAIDGLDPSDSQAYWATGWAWKERFHARITGQMRRLGTACDWSRERFTLDEGYQASTRTAFARLWHAGLITHREGQWWLDTATLAEPLRQALDAGELTITPDRSLARLRHFLDNLEPWCISRQIRWGQPLPLRRASEGTWHLDEDGTGTGEPCHDTLDTWFLSSLWPFAALGWPEATPDLARYYPGAWLDTGEDIIFFWCARMWTMGYFLTGQWPFRELFLHGLLRDTHGQKMSKSLGNGIDPLTLLDQKGADALRWHLALRAEPAHDRRFSQNSWEQDGLWLGRAWNAIRFLASAGEPTPEGPCPADLAALGQEQDRLLLASRFPEAARAIQAAWRQGFCNTWLEAHKADLRAGDPATLQEGWDRCRWLLRLLHPFAPFMTTELHEQLELGATDRALGERCLLQQSSCSAS